MARFHTRALICSGTQSVPPPRLGKREISIAPFFFNTSSQPSKLASINNTMTFVPSIAERLRRMSDTKLRVVFGALLAVSLLANLIASNSGILHHSSMATDDCLWDIEQRGNQSVLVVVEVVSGGEADQAGVKVGDRVIAINGVTLPTLPDTLPQEKQMQATRQVVNYAQTLLERAPVGVPIPYVVERGGQQLTLQMKVRTQKIYVQIAFPLFCALWLLVGAVVLFARPRGRVQQQFFLTAACVVFAFTYPSQLFQVVGGVGIALRLLWGTLGSLFLSLWVLFCTTFPINQRVFTTLPRKLWLYSPVIFTIMGNMVYFVTEIAQIPEPALLQAYIMYGGFFGGQIFFLGGTYFLFRGYRQLPATPVRRPMPVILVGSLLATVSFLYFKIIQILVPTTTFLYPQYQLPAFLILALPISFGYAIYRYQVMDFRRILRTTLTYTATSTLLVGFYLTIAYGISRALWAVTASGTEEPMNIFSPVGIVTFLLLLLLLDPVKRAVQIWIENRFFPQHRDYSQLLTRYTEEISETVGTSAVAALVARTLKQTLDLAGAYVIIEQSDGQFQLLAKVTDFEPIDVEDESLLSLRRLLHESHAIISLETVNDPLLIPWREWFSYVVGLYAQGKAIGAVILTRPRSGQPLGGRQLQLLKTVVAQGAGAVEVARLYETELARQRYQEELATARKIQESLLPKEMPSIPGISISAVARAAQAVGGDYYDVIQLDADRFLVIIADVSGKGLPAALYMAEFHGMVHIACAMHNTPKEILALLNKHLGEVITRGSFITATMLLFDTARMTVSMARAGHTPIIRRHGSEVDSLTPAGIALGLAPHQIFTDSLKQYTVQYEPGETFILFSDGVSEAMNAGRELFGDGRLLDVISGFPDTSAHALCNGILQQVENFRDGSDQNDDIAIVVVEIRKGESVPHRSIPRSQSREK